MRVIFMGTPDFAVPTLRALSESGHEISLVITQQDKQRGRGKKIQFTPVKETAVELGIEVYQPQNVNSEESVEKIKAVNPDAIVVVAYGQILSEEILQLPNHKCLNVHASILPKYRGPAPLNWAVINGESESGVTIMEMAKGLDTGDMMKVEKVDIAEDMTAGDLHDKLMYVGAKALVDTLAEIEAGEAKKTPQNHDEASYAPKMDKELGRIDWNKDAESIKDLIRGTQPWPGSYFYMEDKMIKVRKVRVENAETDREAGKIIDASPDGIRVATGRGTIIIEEIQSPGKRWMTVEDYLRGNSIEENAILL